MPSMKWDRPDVNIAAITNLGTQAEFIQIVRYERGVELAFEGLRYNDIRRWRIAKELTGIVYGMTYEEVGEMVTIVLGLNII